MKRFTLMCWLSVAWTVISSPIPGEYNAARDVAEIPDQFAAVQFSSSSIFVPTTTKIFTTVQESSKSETIATELIKRDRSRMRTRSISTHRATSTITSKSTLTATSTSHSTPSSISTSTTTSSSTSPSTSTTTSAIQATSSTSSSTLSTATATPTAAANAVEVFLRIEGADSTIFQGNILATPGNVTTPSGGTHLCDGTNNFANPLPAGTPTDALMAAAAANGFEFDGTFNTEFQDFFITTIGGVAETATEFWGLLVNYQFTTVGGCEQELSAGQEVLWAYNAFNAVNFLKLTADGGSGPVTVSAGNTVTISVTDGATGVAISAAIVDGQTTDSNGQAVITFPTVGNFALQATKSDSIRSQIISVQVVADS